MHTHCTSLLLILFVFCYTTNIICSKEPSFTTDISKTKTMLKQQPELTRTGSEPIPIPRRPQYNHAESLARILKRILAHYVELSK